MSARSNSYLDSLTGPCSIIRILLSMTPTLVVIGQAKLVSTISGLFSLIALIEVALTSSGRRYDRLGAMLNDKASNVRIDHGEFTTLIAGEALMGDT